MPSFMIVPSLSCQASCKYCFGPHQGAVMDGATARETARFVHGVLKETGDSALRVIFHGGEPLLAPLDVWETLLAELSDVPAGVRTEYSLQSNLWALNDALLALFTRYKVSLGTSLDGPRALCDENRGTGYYDRTAAGIRLAKAAGREVSAIATLTRQTVPHAREILTFFRDNGLNAVVHGAIKSLDVEDSPYALSAEAYGDSLIDLFPWYAKNRKYLRVGTLDNYCRGVVRGDPGVCTLRNCSHMFLAISPTGDVTSCQRMAGKPEFVMGNIFDHPTLTELYDSPAARRLAERERQVEERCGDCAYLPLCKGGCYYNALSAGDGVIDPLCDAYRKVYAFLEGKLADELAAPENLTALNARPPRPGEHPLLRSGPYISLADDVHPTQVAANARAILAAHALCRWGTPESAAAHLEAEKICGDPARTAAILRDMTADLARRRDNLNNCYLHVTFRCNLRCTHCYASAGEDGPEMSPAQFERLVGEALALRFRQVVVTGGEPLAHRQREELLRVCRELRGRGVNLVLRTNLTGDFSDEELLALGRAFDQVVVSVDGDEETHDRRRGAGTYRSVTDNCRRYADLTGDDPRAGELSLACVLSAAEINGPPGQSVRALGAALEVRRVRFRPLLPLGRAASQKEPVICEGLGQHELPEDKLRMPFRPLTSCGIGENVYICPDGKAYPCYAWRTEVSYLGNVADQGLGPVLAGPTFTRLRACTVDTIGKCKACQYRYLCGGACRAWGNQQETDPNTPPPACEHLQRRAEELIQAARDYLARP